MVCLDGSGEYRERKRKVIIAILFCILGAYPVSMALSFLILSGGAVKSVKGMAFVLCYLASFVLLVLPFAVVQFASA